MSTLIKDAPTDKTRAYNRSSDPFEHGPATQATTGEKQMRKHKKLRVKMAPLELSDEGRKPPRDDSSSPRVDESRGKVRAIPPLLDPARGVSLFRRVTLPDSLGAADLVSLRDIPPRIEMAPWRGRIEPSGITTIGGTPGAGAFEVACSAAAMVSNGACFRMAKAGRPTATLSSSRRRTTLPRKSSHGSKLRQLTPPGCSSSGA